MWCNRSGSGRRVESGATLSSGGSGSGRVFGECDSVQTTRRPVRMKNPAPWRSRAASKSSDHGVKGAGSAHFASCSVAFTLLVGAFDVVESIRFGPARRFPRRLCRGGVPWSEARVSGERLGSRTRRSVTRTNPSLVSLRKARKGLHGDSHVRILPTFKLFSTPFLCSLAPRLWCNRSGSNRRVFLRGDSRSVERGSGSGRVFGERLGYERRQSRLKDAPLGEESESVAMYRKSFSKLDASVLCQYR